ncbi:hypothetical protein V3595_01235 [Bacillus sp. CFBP9009]
MTNLTDDFDNFDYQDVRIFNEININHYDSNEILIFSGIYSNTQFAN